MVTEVKALQSLVVIEVNATYSDNEWSKIVTDSSSDWSKCYRF